MVVSFGGNEECFSPVTRIDGYPWLVVVELSYLQLKVKTRGSDTFSELLVHTPFAHFSCHANKVNSRRLQLVKKNNGKCDLYVLCEMSGECEFWETEGVFKLKDTQDYVRISLFR